MRVSANGSKNQAPVVPLANGFSFRLKRGQAPAIESFKRQANVCRDFMLTLTPDGEASIGVHESSDPNFVHVLHENGCFYRYFCNGKGLERIPYGFDSYENFLAFSNAIREFLERIGVRDARVFVVGSAATGRSFEKGEPYDVGRRSDIEIEIQSETLFEMQYRKFQIMLEKCETEYLPDYRRAYEEAAAEYATHKTKEAKARKKKANDNLQSILGIISKLQKILGKRRLPPNYKLPDGFQELQHKVLPAFTDRPGLKVGIRISNPRIPESSDVNESSIRLF